MNQVVLFQWGPVRLYQYMMSRFVLVATWLVFIFLFSFVCIIWSFILHLSQIFLLSLIAKAIGEAADYYNEVWTELTWFRQDMLELHWGFLILSDFRGFDNYLFVLFFRLLLLFFKRGWKPISLLKQISIL